jgi:hypothetical protein
VSEEQRVSTQAIVTIEYPTRNCKVRMEFDDLHLELPRDVIDLTKPEDKFFHRTVGDTIHFSASGDTTEAAWTTLEGGEL